MDEMFIEKFQEKIGVKFRNIEILDLALTHSSYANERGLSEYNERLEFLGDSVLQLCITEYLYKNCKDNNEGDLTRKRASIVCEASLYKVGERWNLGEFIKLSKGEKLSGGKTRISTIADAVEAVIAAVYLDSGYDFVQKFILKFFSDILKTGAIVNYLDHKTRLQEYIQSKTTDKIKYNLIKEEGPPHDKIFYVQVIIGDKNYESGTGKSKKEAEQNAAQKTLKLFE
ncbi:ribonuclease III [Candidatus Arthromitus sp. SFB-mouse-Japan]|uniref:ribonuclease III n=1 Tax=Candidatus Arthromitus sp. SFB-mouse TaxID=49118 RepID=UPI00021B8020|nr:ribonuclease III [Candidatus Arthromitus sp. SFB-mouse]BAK56408.1 ribonuclease III [Candidatus Arthromitus sp. SFB-mouse-Japan]BAK79733.1 ribonuclease III [Candidatus Arthromitus sp. SFB-mouse-Yit]